jgi:putative flippase GtrA
MIQPLRNIAARLGVAWTERAVVLKAVSFALVGLVNSAIDFGVFSFAYYYLALPIIVANTLAWIVAVSGSYVMNSTITFAAESGRRLALHRYAGFALSQVAGFLANTGTVWCLVELARIPAWAAKVVAIGVSFVVNFALSHFVVFRAKKPGSEIGDL